MKLNALRNRINETIDKRFAKITKKITKQHKEILKLHGIGSIPGRLERTSTIHRGSVVDFKM